MRVMAATWAALAVWAFAGAPVAAQSYLADIAEIEAKGELAVGMIDQEFPPMVFTGPGGEPHGFDVRIAEVIADALGVKLSIIRTAKTFDAVVDQVAAGEVDIAVSYLTRTVSRARRVIFTEPYLSQSVALMVNRVFAARTRTGCPTADQFASELEDVTIGVETSGALLSRLASIDPNANLTTVDDVETLMAAVRGGDVDMAFIGEIVGLDYLAVHPDMHVFVSLCTLEGQSDNIAIAVNGELEGLVPFLNVLLDGVSIVKTDTEVRLRIDDWY